MTKIKLHRKIQKNIKKKYKITQQDGKTGETRATLDFTIRNHAKLEQQLFEDETSQEILKQQAAIKNKELVLNKTIIAAEYDAELSKHEQSLIEELNLNINSQHQDKVALEKMWRSYAD